MACEPASQPIKAPKLRERADLDSWFLAKVWPHHAALRAYLRAQFSACGDVEDVLQDTYLRIIRANQQKRITNVRAALFVFARNSALTVIRRVMRCPCASVSPFLLGSIAADAPHPSESVDRRHQRLMLREAIVRLPGRCQAVLRLRLERELTPRQIATELGLSESTVHNQLARAAQSCADHFNAQGVVQDSPRTRSALAA